jgi:hypothetical protein
MVRHAPPSLRRRRPVREPKRLFTIVCEGQNTEPDYFRALRAVVRETRVELVIIPAVGVPMTIAQRSATLARQAGLAGRRRKVASYEENDEIGAVFDRDEHPGYEEAVRVCEASRVGVARSNPCFELWLILHHGNFDRPDGRDAVQGHLESLCPEYDAARGKRPDCTRLIPHIGDAENRAERQLAACEAEGSPYGPPSTTVFALTRSIRRAAALTRGLPSEKVR